MSHTTLTAGASAVDISPKNSVFLYGYPNVPRWSSGVHDPLQASALFISDGEQSSLFLANDIIFIDKRTTQRVRTRIAEERGLPPQCILISATHTHSGPLTVGCLCSEHDESVPPIDVAYVGWLEDQIVKAGCEAIDKAQSVEIGLSIADVTGVGTNRRDPLGPADLSLPVLCVRSRRDESPIALMLICSMHPTVLHENSTLISGDFPGLARQYLQQHVTHPNCPVLYHTGPAGNQSSRHAVRGNTFDEARRLGELVGKAAQQAIQKMQFVDDLRIRCSQVFVDLPLRTMEPLPQAEKKAAAALTRLRDLQASDAPKATVRTAECDWFGAAEAVTLSRAASNGELQHFARSCLPAEVQLIRIGEWNFIAWPGEIFVEFGLELKRRVPNTHIITYANGDLQGYLVTGEAVDEGGYEASNAIFKSPESGNRLVEASLQLLR